MEVHLELCDINDSDIPPNVIKKAVFNHHYVERKVKVAKFGKMFEHTDDYFSEKYKTT